MEAISQAGAAVGILTNDGLKLLKCPNSVFLGIVLAAEKRITSKLIDVRTETEKMYRVDDHIAYLFTYFYMTK